jgi:hypothetical protein
MDEAIKRFGYINKPDGIITSLDADTLCAPNYLSELEKRFATENSLHGATFYFEHPIKGTPHDFAIIEYELHLRYFVEGMRYAGFPFAFHTLGSCFAVRADVYAKHGGMNKKKGGEDFYFLHKIIPNGRFREINSIRIFPSARASERVPFGTGPVVKYLIEQGKDFDSYDIKAFHDLKMLYESLAMLYNNEIDSCISFFSEPLRHFLLEHWVYSKTDEMLKNSSRFETFKKRFFQWFGAFMIVKYLNFAHTNYYKKKPVQKQVKNLFVRLLKKQGVPQKSPKELLDFFREHQKSRELIIK